MKWSHYSRNGKGWGRLSFGKKKKELNDPSHSQWLCCLKERQRPKKTNMINHFITVCISQGNNSQATQWLGNDQEAFVVHKYLLRGC